MHSPDLRHEPPIKAGNEPASIMETKRIPIDRLHELVFEMFMKQHANTVPHRHRQRDRSADVVIEGTVAQGFGVWYASYDFKQQRWTHLFHRPALAQKGNHPSIDLTLGDGSYGYKPYVYPPRS